MCNYFIHDIRRIRKHLSLDASTALAKVGVTLELFVAVCTREMKMSIRNSYEIAIRTCEICETSTVGVRAKKLSISIRDQINVHVN